MNKVAFKVLSIIVLSSLFSCSNSSEFEVGQNKVGLVNSETIIGNIETIFENDSVVKHLSEGLLGIRGAYVQEDDKYLIYEKGGKHLLTITPKEPLDSLSTIAYIDVYDPRYTTKNGLGLNSNFQEIDLLTTVSKIESTFTSATLFLDKINATMSLNKEDLGIKTINTTEVLKEQIPDLVKPKTFVVWFD